MPSNAETLQLIAQVTDRFSAPIRDFTRGLRSLADHSNAAHHQGKRAATEHQKAFGELRKTLKETSENAKQLLEPAMVGLGLGAIGTGVAVEKLTGSIRDFASTAKNLKFFTAETGLATNALRHRTFGSVSLDASRPDGR